MTHTVDHKPHPVALETGVTLHYIERGDPGAPLVVFVHGGGKNWKQWGKQLDPFAAAGYRALAYSRRYAEPNENPDIDPAYNATVDASDLDALLRALELDATPAHLVGASIGGVGCLFYTLAHRDRVRSLTLGEPPILRWALDIPGGRESFERFMADAFQPAGRLFRRGDDERAMGIIMDVFLGAGSWAGMTEAQRHRIMRGARDWGAQSASTDAFPPLDRELVRTITQPALLLTGDRTIPVHDTVDAELARLLPNARRVKVPNATHDMWADAPEFCRAQTLAFLGQTDEDAKRG